jgi:hypothetical protein
VTLASDELILPGEARIRLDDGRFDTVLVTHIVTDSNGQSSALFVGNGELKA